MLNEEDRAFLQTYEPPIFWSDVSCYYWSPVVKLPSGRLCDVKVYNNHGLKWKFRPIPTLSELRTQEENRLREEICMFEQRELKREQKRMMSEIQDNISLCLRGLKALEMAYFKYFD